MSRRRRVVVLAWTHVPARQHDIAEALGGTAVTAPRTLHGFPAPLRYTIYSVWTMLKLVALRPRNVVVTAPPVPAAAVAWAATKIIRARLILDSHPGAFGLMGDHWSLRLQPLHRFVIARSAAVAVTTTALAATVERLNGTSILLHEPPPRFEGGTGTPSFDVFFPTSGGRDEPKELMFEVARRLPHISFGMAGNFSTEGLPSNLVSVGWLDSKTFGQVLGRAKVVACLTNERESVMRTAYEAVYCERPLVVTDTPASRQFFAHSIHCQNDVEAIEEAIVEALRPGSIDVGEQRRLACDTWRDQLNTLLFILK